MRVRGLQGGEEETGEKTNSTHTAPALLIKAPFTD